MEHNANMNANSNLKTPYSTLQTACDVLNISLPFQYKIMKKSYYKLSLKHHPDKHIEENKERNTIIFYDIQEAFTLLDEYVKYVNLKLNITDANSYFYDTTQEVKFYREKVIVQGTVHSSQAQTSNTGEPFHTSIFNTSIISLEKLMKQCVDFLRNQNYTSMYQQLREITNYIVNDHDDFYNDVLEYMQHNNYDEFTGVWKDLYSLYIKPITHKTGTSVKSTHNAHTNTTTNEPDIYVETETDSLFNDNHIEVDVTLKDLYSHSIIVHTIEKENKEHDEEHNNNDVERKHIIYIPCWHHNLEYSIKNEIYNVSVNHNIHCIQPNTVCKMDSQNNIHIVWSLSTQQIKQIISRVKKQTYSLFLSNEEIKKIYNEDELKLLNEKYYMLDNYVFTFNLYEDKSGIHSIIIPFNQISFCSTQKIQYPCIGITQANTDNVFNTTIRGDIFLYIVMN